MSTRRTLWYSDGYHLYQEGFDVENVCLDITSPQFESLILKVPLTVWKEMRKHTIQPNERYLDFTDEELSAEAEREVDAHRAKLDEVRNREGKNVGLLMMSGSIVFGSPESSREEMIQSFVGCYGRGRVNKDSNAV